MKYQSVLVALGVFGAAAAALSAPALAQESKQKPPAAVQKATITIDHGYQPANVSVKAGRLVELTLVRKELSGCGNVVQFPSLGIKRTLKSGERTIVRFTPKKSGSIA